MKALRPLLLAAVLGPVPPAGASPPDAPPHAPAAALADRVAQLNAPDHATRQHATDALLRDDQLDLAALAAAVHAAAAKSGSSSGSGPGSTPAPPLAPEARQRLLNVARHHTVRRLRQRFFPADGPGSIGIVQTVRAQTAPDDRGGAAYVLVNGVLPGFPAYGRLRPLDRITALNGQPIPGPAQPGGFQNMLTPLKANDAVELSLIRAGAPLTVSLTLANRAALSGLYAPPNHTLHPRFAAEWAEQRKPFAWPADGGSPGAPATADDRGQGLAPRSDTPSVEPP